MPKSLISPLFWKTSSIIILLAVIFTNFPFFMSSPAQADSWIGWDAIDTIYYDPSQEDVFNPFLETAASELDTYLEQMSGRSFSVVTATIPEAPAIYLHVNSAELSEYGDEAFRLVTNNDGISITGKTALGVRWGAYYLLDEILGVRWFFRSSAWTVIPDEIIDPGLLNEIHEPDFFWRFISGAAYVDQTNYADWVMHNRLMGDKQYSVYHTYGAILDRATGWYSMSATEKRSYYLAHPEVFLPANQWLESGYPVYPYQLNPENEEVITMATQYAEYILNSRTLGIGQTHDVYSFGGVSISPRDGDGWDPPYSTYQEATDAVFSLVNAVAQNLSDQFSDRLFGVYSYADYCVIPQQELEPNVLGVVTASFNYNNKAMSNRERVEGLLAKGIHVGWYDYVNVWAWFADKGHLSYDLLNRVKWLKDMGISWYDGETTDSWGARGLTYYVLAKMIWDADLDVDTIVEDFYTKAFGPAAWEMKRFFEVSSQIDSPSIAHSYYYLSMAETAASGDPDILARIRQMEFWLRFIWKYHNVGISGLSNPELENFYTFVCQCRDTYILDYSNLEPVLRNEFIDNRGYSSTQVNNLQNFTAPTAQQATTWLNEGLAEFAGYFDYPEYINVRALSFGALGDTETQPVTPVYGCSRDILIPSAGNENVQVSVKTSQKSALEWYDPNGILQETWSQVGSQDWTIVSFTATIPGNYLLRVARSFPEVSYFCWVDVPNRPASIVADKRPYLFAYEEPETSVHTAPEWCGAQTSYFHVPSGIESYIFESTVTNSYNDVSGSLVDPEGRQYPFNWSKTDYTNGASFLNIENPVSGLWKLELNANPNLNYYWFRGIPPLVWHDPEYLLIGTLDANYAPSLNPIGSKTVNEYQTLAFGISAYDPNSDALIYSASNLPAGASFNPSTRAFSWTPSHEQVGSHINVRFEVYDGEFTDFENITITVLSTGGSDVNMDGSVNILDIISITQHVGQTGPNGWIPEDVNQDGAVNVLDVAVVGQNWTG